MKNIETKEFICLLITRTFKKENNCVNIIVSKNLFKSTGIQKLFKHPDLAYILSFFLLP